MNYALEFSRGNRFLMLSRITDIITSEFSSTDFGEVINIHHNSAALENHFGVNVWVHRKGATQALK